MNIQVGDLVQVIRPSPCCGGTESIGNTFVVADVWTVRVGYCICGSTYGGVAASSVAGSAWGYLVSRLIKIDPPPLTEDTPTGEELTA